MVMMSDILTFAPRLDGILPDTLVVRSIRIQLDRLEVMVDIGFHEFEVGTPQRLLVSVEVWLNPAALPLGDCADDAWNYDFLKLELERLAGSRRFNLQERFASEVFDWIAARPRGSGWNWHRLPGRPPADADAGLTGVEQYRCAAIVA